jgi:hypothetical protein
LVIPFYFTLGKCGFIFKPPFSVVVSVNVYVPKDRVTNLHQGYGFVEFRSDEDSDYVSGFWISSAVTCLLQEK